MPEGPEIRPAADRIAHVLTGRRLDEVWFGLPRLVRFSDELRGYRVQGVDTYGKALLIRFDEGLSLYAHNQLYGVWYVRERGVRPSRRAVFGLRLTDRADPSRLAAVVSPPPNDRPVIEAVFVLDTTGSMGGLIQVAKDNGVRVNAVQCGQSGETRERWQQIAQVGGGSFFQVERCEGMKRRIRKIATERSAYLREEIKERGGEKDLLALQDPSGRTGAGGRCRTALL